MAMPVRPPVMVFDSIARPAHGCAQRLKATVQTGRRGPVGDVEDLGHFRHREVEVVVQDQHGPLLDVDRAQLAHDPVPLGELCRMVPAHGRPGVAHHVLLDLGATLVLLRDPVAGTNREPAKPGVPGIGVPQRTHVLPGQHERIVDRILGAVSVAKDEVGDAMQPWEGRSHQL
jgi:hypothetical protein